jgi:hypothetical protein
MSMLQSLEEDEKLLAELMNGEPKEEPVTEPVEETVTEEPAEPVETPVEPKEEVKVEEPVEEQPVDNSAWAKMRRENAKLKKMTDDMHAKMAELESRISQPTNTQPSPEPVDINKDPVKWLEQNQSQTQERIEQLEQERIARSQVDIVNQATAQLIEIENKFTAQTPDYPEVAEFLAKEIKKGIKVLNPHISSRELDQQFQMQVLRMAGQYHSQGLNPAEELYYLAKDDFGYKAPQKEVQEQPVKTDLTKVAANRARNAGTAGVTATSTSGQLSADAVLNMSMAEFSKLPESEKNRLLGVA